MQLETHGGIDMGLVGGGGDSEWNFKMITFCLVIAFLMPLMMSILVPTQAIDVDRDELFDGYYNMTGQEAPTKTAIWTLTGIYTPVIEGQPYGVSEDGWMYNSVISTYRPSQYQGTPEDYTVTRDDNNVYRYSADSSDYNATTGTGHKQGELYTMVNFDMDHKSNIFFTESNKTVMGDNYYFNYSGYRFSFQPISSYNAYDQNGDKVPVIATTSSLSLVFYQWYSQTGVSGQLIVSHSSGGTGYISGSNIVSAFNSANNSATIPMVFNNGVQMDLIFRMDPYYLSTMTVQECYDNGFWSIMVTSQSADADAYTGTDYSLNPTKVLETAIALFTFDYSGYNMSDTMGVLCSIFFVMFLYAGLITMCLANAYIWILVGIMTAIQSISLLNPFDFLG